MAITKLTIYIETDDLCRPTSISTKIEGFGIDIDTYNRLLKSFKNGRKGVLFNCSKKLVNEFEEQQAETFTVELIKLALVVACCPCLMVVVMGIAEAYVATVVTFLERIEKGLSDEG